MLPDGTVSAHHVWKRFRADCPPSSIRDRLERLPELMAARRRSRGWRWALRDIDVTAEPGEAVALVGPNGSGKSTLLKILTGVMYPYAGTVAVGGRIGALIEVRSGIHPLLTGRQNVYVYGALMGLGRREVTKRFDEIVSFAELESAIDRPVKYYSSGMQMRLGFAVAAFLDPDVLLVDEVLAVGDAGFQQRCLDKLRSALAGGTTLVFVSHDLAAVSAMCRRGMLLQEGVVIADGPIDEVLETYRQDVEELARVVTGRGGPVSLRKVETSSPHADVVRSGGPLDVTVVVESDRHRDVAVCLGLSEGTATPILVLRRDLHLPPGETELRCSISRLPLPHGRFALWLGVFEERDRDLVSWSPVADVDVVGPALDTTPSGVVRLAPVYVDAAWETSQL